MRGSARRSRAGPRFSITTATRGAPASTLDYYDQGMQVAFELDVLLRSSGDSLDAAFGDFYRRFAGRGDGYTGEQLRQFLAARLPAAGEVVARAAFSAGRLGTAEALTRLGFQVERGPVPRLGLLLEGNTGPASPRSSTPGPPPKRDSPWATSCAPWRAARSGSPR